uniref:CCHC-type domain-containing protein n=1 Tax=Meloidogyne incognita TaxID=6306 RepID=A0A914NRR0_MELIC
MNKLDLQRILDAQQEKFEEMLARVLKKQAGNGQEEIETSIYCKLSSLISEFSVDIPRDITFDSWFSKNKSYFEEEGKALPESSKVRLLLSKLGSEEYARIERKLLPTKLSEMKLWDLVSELKREFGDPKSQLVKRYEALNLKCQGLEDVIEFGSRVNAQCEKAQMALSIEEIKILIYISGLPSEEQSLRQLAMRFVETKKKQAVPVILKDVIEECRLHLANKAEAVLIAEKPTMVREHAVKVNLVKADNEQPPKEVKEKEEKWKPERQWVPKQVQCEFCGKKGHVKQDCWHYKSPYVEWRICDPEDNLKCKSGYKKKVKVNGHTMEMIIDSGSQINAVTPEVWEDIGAPKLEQVDYKGKGFGDKDFEIEGKWKCIMEIEDKDIIVEMHVVKRK